MMSGAPSIVALIPARSGSKRVSDKNIRLLYGHPLLAYSIASAKDSEIFKDVIVSTDSNEYASIAERYGASVPFLRPSEFAQEHSTDIEWVSYTLRQLRDKGSEYDCFAILRPTSPFRSKDTIRRAWKVFLEAGDIDSLRAVGPCTQHPGKMWVIRRNLLIPLLPYENEGIPWHNSPYQSLPKVYIQNASLEITWSRVALEDNSISGVKVVPFLTKGYEGFDINEPIDFDFAEYLVKRGEALLPICRTVR
jgi:CMP-N,N'-diacetyllegionaminic acid synthase